MAEHGLDVAERPARFELDSMKNAVSASAAAATLTFRNTLQPMTG